MKLRNSYIAGLEVLGFAEVESKATKFRLFHKPGSSVTWVWVGKAGSIRFSNLRRFETSIPFSSSSKATIIAKGAA